MTRCLPVRAGIEELREKREELNRSVAADEEEKGASVAHTLPTVPPWLPPACTGADVA